MIVILNKMSDYKTIWKVTIIGNNCWITKRDKSSKDFIYNFNIEDIMFSKLPGNSILIQTAGNNYIFIDDQIYKFKSQGKIQTFDGKYATDANDIIYDLKNLIIHKNTITVKRLDVDIIQESV